MKIATSLNIINLNKTVIAEAMSGLAKLADMVNEANLLVGHDIFYYGWPDDDQTRVQEAARLREIIGSLGELIGEPGKPVPQEGNEIERAFANALLDQAEAEIADSSKYFGKIPNNLPHPATVSCSAGHYPYLYYPYNRELIAQIGQIMIDANWEWKCDISEKDVRPGQSVRYSANRSGKSNDWVYECIVFEFNDFKDGSTCKRVKIGTRMVAQDVYELVCAEGAAESTKE